MTPPLRDYQVADLAFYMTQDRVLNASDPGVGKTPSACVYSFHRWNNDQARSVWVQPKSIMRKNWEEMIRFTPFTSDDVAVVDGTPKQKAKALASGAKVLCMTAESLKKHGPNLGSDFQLLVGDEWHMIYGGHGSQRTQALYDWMHQRKWMIAMSGTIINGRLDTIYPWIQLVNPLYYGSYNQFMAQHAVLDSYDNVMAWTNPDKIAKIVQRHGIRRTFEDAYGPEAKVIETEKVEMSPKQRAAYDKFDKEAMLELETCFLDGSLPGVALIRARQIMGHPEDILGDDLMKGERTGKDERLLIHAEDHKRTGSPFIVFTPLVRTQERIYWLLQNAGIATGLINGSVSGSKRAEIDRMFKEGKLQAIVASEATAGLGYNWMESGGVEVPHVIFEGMGFLDGAFMQAYRRCIRGVRKTPLRISILEYENSIDQRLYEIVRQKSELANSVDSTRPVFDLAS